VFELILVRFDGIVTLRTPEFPEPPVSCLSWGEIRDAVASTVRRSRNVYLGAVCAHLRKLSS
jgi:hypothetical protein